MKIRIMSIFLIFILCLSISFFEPVKVEAFEPLTIYLGGMAVVFTVMAIYQIACILIATGVQFPNAASMRAGVRDFIIGMQNKGVDVRNWLGNLFKDKNGKTVMKVSDEAWNHAINYVDDAYIYGSNQYVGYDLVLVDGIDYKVSSYLNPSTYGFYTGYSFNFDCIVNDYYFVAHNPIFEPYKGMRASSVLEKTSMTEVSVYLYANDKRLSHMIVAYDDISKYSPLGFLLTWTSGTSKNQFRLWHIITNGSGMLGFYYTNEVVNVASLDSVSSVDGYEIIGTSDVGVIGRDYVDDDEYTQRGVYVPGDVSDLVGVGSSSTADNVQVNYDTRTVTEVTDVPAVETGVNAGVIAEGVTSALDSHYKTGTLDFSGFRNLVVYDKFPFCIPNDFYRTIKAFSAKSIEPNFTINLDLNYVQINHTINLAPFNFWIRFMRYVFLLAFVISLLFATRKLIKW